MRNAGTESPNTRSLEGLINPARLCFAERTRWTGRALVWVMAAAMTIGGATAAIAPDTLSPALHRPIASVLTDAGEGDEVIVRGMVRERTGPSTYIIEDESGNAHVRVRDALLSGGLALAAGTPVEIHGRVRSTLTRGARIEAQKVTVLRASEVPLGAGDVWIR